MFSRNRNIKSGPHGVWNLNLFEFKAAIQRAVKDKAYANNPQKVTDLKAENHETIENALKKWAHRMGYCQVSHGGHLTEIFINKCHMPNFQINAQPSKNIELIYFFAK